LRRVSNPGLRPGLVYVGPLALYLKAMVLALMLWNLGTRLD